MGVGPTELAIISLVVVVLFGPTLLAFWIGYLLGKRRAVESAVPAPTGDRPDATTAEATESTQEENHTDE